jgi:hypothetical protein
MVTRIGGSFYQPSSFNRYEKKKQQEDQEDSQNSRQQPEETPIDESHEETPLLYASTLLHFSEPEIEDLSPEAKVNHTFSNTRHSDNQVKAIESLMTSFTSITDENKRHDIASLVTSATKKLSSNAVQQELCKSLESLFKLIQDKKCNTRIFLGYINLLENNTNAIRLLKNKAIYLNTVQELNIAQRRVFQSLSQNTHKITTNKTLLKELIRVTKSTIYLCNETTQQKGLLLIHEIAKKIDHQDTDPTFIAFMLTSLEELKHIMKNKPAFETIKKAFDNVIITLSEHLS